MTTKTKASAPPPSNGRGPAADCWFIPPLTMETRLVRIQALGQQIAKHIQFICTAGNLVGASEETKQKTVAVFYERLLAQERELARIQEDFRLE